MLVDQITPIAASPAAPGEIGGIPVRNLWLLMLYASQLYRHLGRGNVAVEDNPDDIPDLVAEILAAVVGRRLKRNLTYEYRTEAAILGRVRGRIDLLRTERCGTLRRGKVACRFETLTVDTPRNRFVRAALSAIAPTVHRPTLAHRCRTLAGSLDRLGVSNVVPSRAEISSDRYGRHDADDRMMVEAARLAFDLALPTESAGSRSVGLPSRDVKWVRKLFEKAVGGFYDVVLSPQGWRVAMGQPLDWMVEQKTPGIDALLPSMRTDVVLTHVGVARRIVIDTKFANIITPGWFRHEVLKSGYLYQMYAYLRSQEGNGNPLSDRAAGLLLHPSVGKMVNETVTIQGHPIRFGTVDLTGTATAIREQLLRVIEFSNVMPNE